MQTIRKAYVFRLKTNDEIESKISRFCGSGRFLWNKCFAMNLNRLEKGQALLWYNELAFWLTLWKGSDEYGFLKECPSQVLQQKLRDLDRAFRDCFDKTQPMKRLPVFKKKGKGDSIRFPQGFRIVGRRIFLPKIGWIGFYKSRSISGKIKNISVSKKGEQWYASIQVEQMIEIPRHQDTLAKEQRKLSRKKKGLQNWKKQKKKISGLHNKIYNVRKDFLNKLSTETSKNHAQGCMLRACR